MMFKLLRNKILLINMILTSMIMMIAFAAIYLIMNHNIQSENIRQLERNISIAVSEAEANGEVTFDIDKELLPTDYLLSFSIKVNQDGTIKEIDSLINMPEDLYHQAAQSAWKNENRNGQIKVDNKIWLYSIVPDAMTSIISENGKDIIITAQESDYRISFLDITASMETLRKLALSFIVVGLVMLFFIFLISLVFANRSIKPVSEAWEKQKRFITDASHELKTPLSIINANYDVLVANKNETIISQMKWFDYMKSGTDRMADLINSMLSLARMEREDMVVQKVPFNMSEKICEMLQSIEAAIYKKEITLSQSIEPKIIVNSDMTLVLQVLMILTDNAIKYTEPNGCINVTFTHVNHQVIFSIKNSGKGIPAQGLTKVFDRFYQADQSRTYESKSYGLGLSIAKAITDALGGDIQVESIEEEYTVFTFRLTQ